MAFSLEAALTVPLAVTAWIGLVSAAAPYYEKTCRTAAAAADAVTFSIQNTHLYNTCRFGTRDCQTTGLQVSPQDVIEITKLAADDLRLATRHLSGGGIHAAETEGDAP